MIPQRVFLTGEPGCGKTTAVLKTIELLLPRGIRAGGMISGEMREAGTRVGFSLEDVFTHERGILAHVAQEEGPRVGRYRVNLFDLERIGVGAIRRAVSNADIIVVDELGPMELNSRLFIETVEAALSAPKHFLGTIHRRGSHPLVTAIRSNSAYETFEVKLENRDRIPTAIAGKIVGAA